VLRNQIEAQPANTTGATRESVLGLPALSAKAPAPVRDPAPHIAPTAPRQPSAPRDGVLVIRGLDAASQSF